MRVRWKMVSWRRCHLGEVEEGPQAQRGCDPEGLEVRYAGERDGSEEGFEVEWPRQVHGSDAPELLGEVGIHE